MELQRPQTEIRNQKKPEFGHKLWKIQNRGGEFLKKKLFDRMRCHQLQCGDTHFFGTIFVLKKEFMKGKVAPEFRALIRQYGTQVGFPKLLTGGEKLVRVGEKYFIVSSTPLPESVVGKRGGVKVINPVAKTAKKAPASPESVVIQHVPKNQRA